MGPDVAIYQAQARFYLSGRGCFFLSTEISYILDFSIIFLICQGSGLFVQPLELSHLRTEPHAMSFLDRLEFLFSAYQT